MLLFQSHFVNFGDVDAKILPRVQMCDVRSERSSPTEPQQDGGPDSVSKQINIS